MPARSKNPIGLPIEKIGQQSFVDADGNEHLVPIYQVLTPIKPTGFVANMSKKELLDILEGHAKEIWHGHEAFKRNRK